MKALRRLLLGAGFLALLYLAHAQQAADSSQPATNSPIFIPPMNPNGPLPSLALAFDGIQINNTNLDLTSVGDLQTMLEALESEPPTPLASLPTNRFGQVISTGFWSLQNPYWPPLPSDIYGVDVWPLGTGSAILDDWQVDYNAPPEAQTAPASRTVTMSMMASSLSTAYAYRNPVYLTNMAASFTNDGSITTSFSITGGTNFVPYNILMSTNVATPVGNWNWIGIGYTSNRYTFYKQPASSGFYILAKPSKTMTVGFGGDIYGQCNVPSGVTNALTVAAGYGYSLGLLNNGTVVGWGNSGADGWVPTNLVGNVAMIAAGWDHNVALLTNGTVQAWGANVFGVLNVPANLTNATVISAQALHTLALSSNGTVVAWGDDDFGQCDVPAGLTNVTAIAAGGEHSLAVSNGFVVAWGDNYYGQCHVPSNLSNVWDVAGSGYHSLALKRDGTVTAWGDNSYGECSAPSGLSNVVAIAAGGDDNINDQYLGHALPYSLALKSDGSVVAWGAGMVLNPVQGVSNVISISGGVFHALAIRTGPPTPVIAQEPTDQYQVTNGNVTFTARGAGLYGVTYQWQTNGVNLSGATNAMLTVSNVQPAILGPYDVVITDNGGMGSLVSSNAFIHLVSTPVITSETLPATQFVLYPSSLTLQVSASAPWQNNGFPLTYQWQFNGTNISGATSSSFTAANSGTYSVIVSNAAGSVSYSWLVNVLNPGGVIGWGSNSNGQLNASSVLTNVISLAAGTAHGIVALDSGSVSNWGSYWTGTNFVPAVAPPPLTNALAVAAGSRHDLVLKTDGTVVAWGLNDYGQTNVPATATNAVAIAAGGQQSLGLLKNQTVLQWGQTNAPIPAGLTNVAAIAAGTNFALALLQNSTVVAWGANNYGQTNVPAGLSNVVAIAAGGAHALALKIDGTATAWGAWTNVPSGLSNVLNVAAGENHGIALKNDGTVVAWGDNTFGQTNNVSGLNKVKLIAGGGNFTLAVQFSPTVSYPVNVSQDLLLIYNTNSVGSTIVENYYLQNRPLASNANVLAIGCTTNETFLPTEFTNVFITQIQNWLAANPTKRPQYVVLFPDIPSRINVDNTPGSYNEGAKLPSVQYQIYSGGYFTNWNPFVASINMNGANGTNDCIAYINKLAFIATNYSPGKIIISASAGGYGNTNYYFDDTECCYSDTLIGGAAAQAVLQDGVSSNSIVYTNVYPDCGSLACHITSGVDVAGYLSWGQHSSLTAYYATDGDVNWTSSSGWWVIETIESFNGERDTQSTGQGNFLEWFSSNAFGGTNYSNTPVGAVSNVDEPNEPPPSYGRIYFGLWANGKNSAICAWNAINSPEFQVVGDPFVAK